MHRDEPMTCPSCGWTGDAKDYKDFHSDLFDVCCPECDRMILSSFPTVAETRAAAAVGNQRGAAGLPGTEAQQKKWAAWARRADEMMLRNANELPQLDGDRLVIEWDIENCDGEKLTVLRHGDLVIWREIAFWEGIGLSPMSSRSCAPATAHDLSRFGRPPTASYTSGATSTGSTR